MKGFEDFVAEPDSLLPAGAGKFGSLLKSIFSSNLNPGLALAMILFMAVFAAGTVLVASSETSEQGYNLFSPPPARVLGQITYGPTGSVFVAMGYRMADYSAGRWNARIDYYLQGVNNGSVYVNRNLFLNNVAQSGSAYTGYNLVPGSKYEFIFYALPFGRGRVLARMTVPAPEAPAYGYYNPPPPPPPPPPVYPYGYSTPSITVLSPTGGEQWAQGSTQTIRWSTTGNISHIRIMLIPSDPGVGTRTIAENIPNTGSYLWYIPNCTTGPCSSNFEVPVGSFQMQVSDISSAAYSQGGVFNVIAVPAQVQPRVGQLVSINSTIYLVGDQGLFGIPNLNVFNSWCFSLTDIVPANSAEIALPQIGVLAMRAPGQTLPVGVSVLRVSTCPAATSPIISGVGGPTTLNVGQMGTWTVSASDPQNRPLSYAVNWGDVQPVPKDNRAAGAYLPQQTATFTHVYNTSGVFTVYFKVSNDSGGVAYTSITVNVNAISSQPSITVISPNGGEQWQVGGTYIIGWAASGFNTSDTTNIVLLDASTSAAYSIADSVLASAGSYSWTIPHSIPVGFYKIMFGYKSSLNATSNASFSIIGSTQRSPGQVQNLTASVSGNTVNLSWSAVTQPAGSTYAYLIYRSTVQGFTPSGTPGVVILRTSSTSYADINLAAGIYYYRVVVYDQNYNFGTISNEVSASVAGVQQVTPYFIQNGVQTASLTCGVPETFNVPGYSQVWLVQIKNGVQAYNGIYNVPSAPYTPSCSSDYGTYINTVYTLVNGTQGQYLGSVTATISYPIGIIPAGIQNLTAIASGNSIILSWANACPSTVGYSCDYLVSRSTNPNTSYGQAVKVNTLSYTDANLSSGTYYYFVMAEVISTGITGPGANVSATINAIQPVQPYFTQNGIQATYLLCGVPEVFNVPGYSQVWLVQIKNGVQGYNGIYSISSTPYTPSCKSDLGTYVNTIYTVVGGAQGQYLSSVTATINLQ